jgi:hypothetical protein
VIKGEGRINDVPDTKISKSGWSFPFIEEESLFHIVGKKIDVVIENLHFDNFNGSCISTSEGNSFVARNNRFTLLSSLGRGLSFGKWGDHIVGITVGGEDSETSFPGGVILEGNYLDFALSYEKGGFLDYDGLQSNPEYRPELLNHELGICVGLNIHGNCGKVIVRDNIIRNMNSRGILTFDNWDTAEIIIEGNRIESNVFGAYPYNSMMAGVGIMAQSAWSMPYSSGKVVIKGNKINLKKVNYCGIVVHGPATYTSTDGSSKLVECQIVDNDIHLDDGYLGIQVRKSDNTLIENNRLSGKAYYGLQISGAAKRNNIELHSRNNRFIGNNLDALEIKTPDTYSYNNMKRSNFVGIHVVGGFIQPHTAHVWLTDFTEGNIIELRKADETIIDQGKDNVIKTETPDR